jgi:magnesium transporter
MLVSIGIQILTRFFSYILFYGHHCGTCRPRVTVFVFSISLQVLFQGLKASATQIITIVMAFIVICFGITILQMSKVDPTSLSKLDRRSTILLQAARQNTEATDEKLPSGFEDPGIDALRGSFGTFGSIIRANTARRMSKSGRGSSSLRNRTSASPRPYDVEADTPTTLDSKLLGMTRHQLYDAPVPRNSMERDSSASSERRPTIKFDAKDVVHQYHPTGKSGIATHEQRDATRGYPYPPIANVAGISSPNGADISETNLVDVDALQQTVTVTPHPDEDPRTAPPSLQPSFFEKPKRSAFKDTPATTTLSTFPSTDSSGDEETQKARAHTHRYGRSYPRGEDDKDESVSLWPGDQASLDEEEPSRVGGGIRLVKPSSGTRF